ncbi:Heat shock protein 70 family [Pelomyxa schiedti]|nr:Heat shock protein 70 family [Pelomyxa schiedti]
MARDHLPEFISGLLLAELRRDAEKFLGQPVRDVGSHSERSGYCRPQPTATYKTAAALGYSIDPKQKKGNLLVFDLGGGTFDVSVVESTEEGTLFVNATCSNSHLGGQDFTRRIVDFLLKDILQRFGKDLTNDYRARGLLHAACERAKVLLSSEDQTCIEIFEMFEGTPSYTRLLTRGEFEDLNMNLFISTLHPIDVALKYAKLTMDEALGDDPVSPHHEPNPDEAVAHGAAIQAAILTRSRDHTLDEIQLFDVVSQGLGYVLQGGEVEYVIEPCTSTPCDGHSQATAPTRYGGDIIFNVVKGHRKIVNQCAHLGEFILRVGPNQPIINVTFAVDHSGLLEVSAECKGEKGTVSNKIRVDKPVTGLTREQVDVLQREAQEMVALDSTNLRLQQAARVVLEEHVRTLQEITLRNLVHDEVSKAKIKGLCDKTLSWISRNQSATTEAYEDKLEVMNSKEESIRLHARSRVLEYITDIRRNLRESTDQFRICNEIEDWIGSHPNATILEYEATSNASASAGASAGPNANWATTATMPPVQVQMTDEAAPPYSSSSDAAASSTTTSTTPTTRSSSPTTNATTTAATGGSNKE